ncbi:MAG: galactose mutarotase-like enzyme [Algoriphagus sp.]|jgi:galactose mutarotase-like enzyme
MIYLENDRLKVGIIAKGAELKSLVNKSNGLEHIWQADPSFWAKSSPILFPIVGGLKDGLYHYKGTAHKLPRHGFARDNVFEIVNQSSQKVVFSLKSNEETTKDYPFDFELKLIYTLSENELEVAYEVINRGEELMYFSIGAHPAFSVPFAKNESYDEYSLTFGKDEVLNQWPLNSEGLMEAKSFRVNLENKEMPLSKSLFYKDALVYKDLKSESIILKSSKSDHYLKFKFNDFPFFGIWAAKDANFICLEPWCGIADSGSHSQELIEKEGINQLASGQTFKRKWSLSVH